MPILEKLRQVLSCRLVHLSPLSVTSDCRGTERFSLLHIVTWETGYRVGLDRSMIVI
jgi:hypothetical protein